VHRRAHRLFYLCLVISLALLAAQASAQVLTTLAGGGPNNVAALSAPVGQPWAVARDQAGNTYISDNISSRIYKVSTNNVLTVFAGNIVSNYSGDGGAASLASLCRPEGIAVDASGNVYIADTGDSVIRVVNTQAAAITVAGVTIQPGTIQTVAGTGLPGYSGDGAAATSAKLNNPGGLFVDHSGNIFIADTLNSVVRKVNASGTISTVAGNFSLGAGYSGDGGSATSAQLNQAAGVYLDGTGNLYIADTLNNRVRAVNTQPAAVTIATVTIQPGDIQTIAGNGTAGFAGDTGSAISAEINAPQAIMVGSGGTFYIADSNNNVVREVTTGGIINTFAGNYTIGPGASGNGGLAVSAQLNFPTGLSLDNSGDVFIADQNNAAVREVMAGNADIELSVGIMQNVAYFGDGGNAALSELFSAAGVGSDSSGNIYIADSRNSRIRVINTQSSQITVAGVSIAPGTIATVAGSGVLCVAAPCGDGGAALSAQLSFPVDVMVDASGNIIFVDYQPLTGLFPVSVVREIVAGSGMIQTVAGSLSKGPGYSGDGGAAVNAQLNQASGLSLDKSGNLFIADMGNNVVRAVNTQSAVVNLAGVSVQPGNIVTVAGNGTKCANGTAACGDGALAINAQFNAPSSVALDRSGNLYLADSGDNRVREVLAGSGNVEAYAGTGVICTTNACGDGGPATAAELSNPFHVFSDYLGDIFIADNTDYVVREVTAANGMIQTVAGNATRGFSGDNGNAIAGQFDNVTGLAADAAGNLLVADFGSWRVRRVTGLAATAPTANLSTATLSFPAQTVGEASQSQAVKLSNNGNLSPLPVSSIVFSGPQAGDFAETDDCLPSVPGHGSCEINVTFKPMAVGARSATMTITDNGGSTQKVSLSGTGMIVASKPDFSLSAGALSAVNPGQSASSSVNLSSINGFSGSVVLSCSVTPTPQLAPTCAFSKSAVTLANGGSAASLLTVSTTAVRASLAHSGSMFYAMWLLFPAMLLGTAGAGTMNRKKAISYFLIGFAVMGCLFLVACGSGSQASKGNGGNPGGGGGGTGTPAGVYTITVTGTSGTNVQSQKLVLTVK
jgi:trimeric autotransporter adhesin